ncbi:MULTISPECIES: PRTRC system protein B [Flavobacteriales]|uniref:PRTRC system protein B n=1 Tax=Chryseobacterium bernardetii TaxID=1241978 RepID=A0A3G6TBL4_9FLAO|nr:MULTISPECIES: PRTRC system protein B [Flavobacteriales]AZB25283.1 PRTRC system protein B [Chryseobacterium bernardetii]
MNNVIDTNKYLGMLYEPKSALVFYESLYKNEMYVEHFDMDRNGNPINAHPLTVNEAKTLAKSLVIDKEIEKAFLKSKGILANNILHINPSQKGSVIWYTKAQERQMYFVKNLEIPSGKAKVPAMLWIADKENLSVFALSNDKRPTENTTLHYAPFFNVYNDGDVCMGNVDIKIQNSTSVEEFIEQWESYFFNSYFSHLVGGHNPIDGNLVNLWKKLLKSNEAFPNEILKKNNKTLKNLLR